MSTPGALEKDPFSFDIQLNTDEARRDFHGKNEEGEIQRPNVVDNICRGLLLQARVDRIAHGTESKDGHPATLVVFGFRFHGIDEKRRFKRAIITMTFGDEQKRPKADPEVIALWPNGDFTLGEPTDVDIEHTTSGEVGAETTTAGVTSTVAQAGVHTAMQWEKKKSYTKKDQSRLKGSIILDTKVRDYGLSNAVRLTISEDTTATSGLVADFRAVVLLKRRNNDCFLGTVRVNAMGHFAYNAIQGLRDLTGFTPGNDPVKFKPGVQYLRPPMLARFLETKLAAEIDEDNLNAAKLDELGGVLGSMLLATSV
ncbi:hypothetical protein QQX98_011597 [Neonectria punicea]|uniref:Uncharacterized protein n=1 Tax=Neonectria punicea TaxID=979145 RepID=A0ABR1GLA3_9HYPO